MVARANAAANQDLSLHRQVPRLRARQAQLLWLRAPHPNRQVMSLYLPGSPWKTMLVVLFASWVVQLLPMAQLEAP
jgi:hypothetical protein